MGHNDWRSSLRAWWLGLVAIHLLALGCLALAPQYWLAWALLPIALTAPWAAAGLLPRCSWLGPNWVRVPSNSDGVVLSFDDGPDPEVTPQVLQLLNRYGAKASFFCIGERAEAHPELVQEIVAAGHSVENHTWSHPHTFWFLGPTGLRTEIGKAQSLLARTSGATPRFFRAPAGIRSPLLQPILAEHKLTLASWTRRAFDTQEKDATKVVTRLTQNLRAGDILLLHDGTAARDKNGEPVILKALPLLLDRLREAGLQSVSFPSECDG